MGLFLKLGLKVLEIPFGFRTKCCMGIWALGMQREEWFVHLSLCWHALHVTLDNSHHLLGIWLHI